MHAQPAVAVAPEHHRRAARTVDNGAEEPVTGSTLLSHVVAPALTQAEKAFASALSRISVEDLARAANSLRK